MFDADIPVVIAVASKHFADWIKFAGGMSVKLSCERGVLDAWWAKASMRSPRPASQQPHTVCEFLK
jgi:hypothetical protein